MMVARFPIEDNVSSVENTIVYVINQNYSLLLFLRLSVLFEHKAGDITSHLLLAKNTILTWTHNQAVRFKRTDCHCILSLHNPASLPFIFLLLCLSFFSPFALLAPSSLFVYWSLEETCLLFQPGLFPLAFAHSSQCLFCPSEADALNKMTTVICLCHSGPSTDYIVAQKYSARGGGRMCVSAGSNSLFFYFPESCLFH